MDEIDSLLAPVDAERQSATHDAVWRSTTRVLRNRRWVRHARRGAMMIACFAAGAATVHWTTHKPPLAESPIAVAPPEPESSPADPFRNDSPKSLERWASLAKGEKRSDLYRRAGDGFLERGDELSAIRCYKGALNSAVNIAVRPDQDTWLMMSMKLSRQKETTDATN